MSSGPTHSVSFDSAIQDHPTHAPPFVSAEGEQTSTQASDKFSREQALARSFEESDGSSQQQRQSSSAPPYPTRGSGGVSASEVLIAKNLHLSAIKTLADQFGGRVVDVAENSCIVELTAKSSRVDAFLALMRPFGVLEAARSGGFLIKLFIFCFCVLYSPWFRFEFAFTSDTFDYVVHLSSHPFTIHPILLYLPTTGVHCSLSFCGFPRNVENDEETIH